MSRGQYPLLLMLAMGLPTTSWAIGLGDIRVDSALNEPLSAQIDIIGANRDELAALTARAASPETFRRYGVDRPAFLSSATFRVGIGAEGRPVLTIKSTQSFTDPVVGLVVDLRWGRGELIREYSLLLDPAGHSPPKRPSAASTAAATLSDSRSPSTAARPIVASAPEAAAPVAAVADERAAKSPQLDRAGPPQPSDAAATVLLRQRVQSLEQALEEARKQVASESNEIGELKLLAAPPAVSVEPQADVQGLAPPASRMALPSSLAMGLALLLAAFAHLRRRLSRPQPSLAHVVPAHRDAPMDIASDQAAALPPASANQEVPPAATVVDAPQAVAPLMPEVREISDPPTGGLRHDYTEVDIEALEKSYLDAQDAVLTEVHPQAIQDTAIMETQAAEKDCDSDDDLADCA